MGFVLGRNVILYVAGDYGDQVIYCARSCALNTSADLLETTTIGSGADKSFKQGRKSWQMSCDGLVKFAAGLDVTDIWDKYDAADTVNVTIKMDDTNGYIVTYIGTAIINSINITGTNNEVASYSVSFQGTGPLSKNVEIRGAIVDEDGAFLIDGLDGGIIIDGQQGPDFDPDDFTDTDFVT